MKETEKKYTYTVHLAFRAASDFDARMVAEALRSGAAWAVGKGVVLLADLTDADDWSEHVTSRCRYCDSPPVDRVRFGDGHRRCAEHINLFGGDIHPIQTVDVVDEEQGVKP